MLFLVDVSSRLEFGYFEQFREVDATRSRQLRKGARGQDSGIGAGNNLKLIISTCSIWLYEIFSVDWVV
jgi:hypothetical protein